MEGGERKKERKGRRCQLPSRDIIYIPNRRVRCLMEEREKEKAKKE